MDKPAQTLWWGSNTDEKTTKKHRTPWGVLVGFLAIVVTLVSALALSPDPHAPQDGPYAAKIYPAKALEAVGQCGGYFTFDVPQQFSGQIPARFFERGVIKEVPTHPMIVPAYGYFNSVRSEPVHKFLKPNQMDHVPESTEYLSYVWQGWTIIWYKPDVDANTLNSIQKYVNEHSKVAAFPWDESYHGRPLPLERSFGYSTWGVTMSCGLWDDRILDNFHEFTQSRPRHDDISNPHLAPLDERKNLYPIAIPAWN